MKKAFTTIEVLVVVVILGILVSIAIPGYSRLKKSTEYREALGFLELVRAGAKYYDLKYGISGLPTGTGAWTALKIDEPAGPQLNYAIISGPRLEIQNQTGAWLYRYNLVNGTTQKRTGHADYQYLPKDLP
jgi:prepilin-type N-terminal cleavage/methylation domain-containing protein